MIQPIEIKGIVRNTTKQNSENGTMEEIINLRRRDGNLEPMSPEQKIWEKLDNDVDGVSVAEMFSQFFIHNGNNYKHLLGIASKSITSNSQGAHVGNINAPYPVRYIGDIVDTEEIGDVGLPIPDVVLNPYWYDNSVISVESDDAVIHQVGNLLTIHSGNKLQNILWSEDKYVDVTIDWSGSQHGTDVAPDFRIDLRAIPHCDKDGDPLLFATGGAMGEGHNADSYNKPDIITNQSISIITQARALAKECGVLNGYCIAVTALQLYDGSYICASRPVLIPKALAGIGDVTTEEQKKSLNVRLNKNFKTKMFGNSNATTEDNGQGTFYYETTYRNSVYRLTTTSAGAVDGVQKVHITQGMPDKSAFAILSVVNNTAWVQCGADCSANTYNLLACTRIDDKDACWGVITGNDIQVRFPKELLDSRLSDIVKSVSVFITDEEYESETTNELSYENGGHSINAWLKNTDNDKIAERLTDKSVMYEVFNKRISELRADEWITIDLSHKLPILEQQLNLPVDSSTTRVTTFPSTSYQYNGRLHIADIKQDVFKGFPLKYFEMLDTWGPQYAKVMQETASVHVSDSASELNNFDVPIVHDSGYTSSELAKSWSRDVISLGTEVRCTFVIAHIKTNEGWQRVGRIEPYRGANSYHKLNPILFYPDSRCRLLQIGTIEGSGENVKSYSTYYQMSGFKALEGSVYIDLEPINWYANDSEFLTSMTPQQVVDFMNTQNVHKLHLVHNYNMLKDVFDFAEDGKVTIKELRSVVYRPNVLKVSAVETPLFFPANNTYQIGNGEIRGVCANTTALSVGQWGDAPLFVFASDGVYGLFVDSSGELVYGNSRPISREVCNNPKSITPVDDAIVFSSERGLMTIAGSQVTEISQPIEGKVLKFATADTNPERLDSAKRLLGFEEKDILAWVDMKTMPTDEEAKEYLRNAIIGYNYDNKEIWVANPSKDYVYIFSEGVWVKGQRKILSFISDYPSTYALLADHSVVDLARSTKEVTDTFFLTRPIVLDGENAKHFTKVWLYGDFNVVNNKESVDAYVDALTTETAANKAKLKTLLKHKASLFVYGSADGARYSMIGCGGIEGVTRNIVTKVHRMSLRYIRILFVGKLEYDSRVECLMTEYKNAYGVNSTIKPR